KARPLRRGTRTLFFSKRSILLLAHKKKITQPNRYNNTFPLPPNKKQPMSRNCNRLKLIIYPNFSPFLVFSPPPLEALAMPIPCRSCSHAAQQRLPCSRPLVMDALICFYSLV